MPGVGPLTALAVEAFAPAMQSFRCGRDFAAWLGLVPRQFSSGGKKGSAGCRRLVRPHPQAPDHRGNGLRQLGGSQTASARIVAFADAREEAAHAGGDRAGEQDGSENLGHADEAGRLSRPSSGNGGDREPSRITRTGKEV